MAVSTDIVRSWRRPRVVIREILSEGQREDRLIGVVMAACLLIFVAQWPRLARKSQGFELADGAEVPEMSQLVAYEMLSWLIVWPLLLYAIAAITRIIASLFRGKGTQYGARLSLFWALLASAPVLLLHGLTMGFIGPGSAANLVGTLWLGLFMWIWSQGLWVSESGAVDVT